MDPTMHPVARTIPMRSVQGAVMSAPTTTIASAVEAARRAARAFAVPFAETARAMTDARATATA